MALISPLFCEMILTVHITLETRNPSGSAEYRQTKRHTDIRTNKKEVKLGKFGWTNKLMFGMTQTFQ